MGEEADDVTAQWRNMLSSRMVDAKKCFTAAVGDSTRGCLWADVTNDDSDWSFLYNGGTYTREVLTEDLETKTVVEVNEQEALREALEATTAPEQGIYLGGKKYRVMQLQEFPSKSYPDHNVKALVIGLGKIVGCVAVDGGYFVIGLIDTNEVEQKNLAAELACDVVAELASYPSEE